MQPAPFGGFCTQLVLMSSECRQLGLLWAVLAAAYQCVGAFVLRACLRSVRSMIEAATHCDVSLHSALASVSMAPIIV